MTDLRKLLPGAFVAVALMAAPAAAEPPPFDEMRQMMVAEVVEGVRHTEGVLGKSSLDPRVIEAMRELPRERFVPEDIRPFAYLNRPLPVGHGQTVSQPYIVAVMADLAALQPDDKVLLIGVGGGYFAGLLANLVREVHTVELIEEVEEQARATFADLGLDNIHSHVGDGYYGWRDAAPYDAIIIRLSVGYVPGAISSQLKPGGRLVAPVGPRDDGQDLMLIERDTDGRLRERAVMPVRFTRLPGGERI